MREKEKKILTLLTAALVLVVLSVALAVAGRWEGPSDYYETQVQAARQLEACFEAVEQYKQELGIPMSEEDLHQTGMIGQSYTGITTTLGAPEAKRTTAWPDMAALCVRLLHEAGVQPGDTVGAGFSGSFPGMDLAVVTACESMGVELICIPSVGASTYGANDPELTFPEMLCRLEQDGLITTRAAAVTMGGSDDIGADMDRALAADIRERLTGLGLEPVELPDFEQNIRWREELYRERGPIDCFIAVGGNLTSLGQGEDSTSVGQGVLQGLKASRLHEKSGLVQRYQAVGVPVINLLNIKKLVADYDLPYDPVEWPEIGQSAVYMEHHSPRGWVAVGLAGAAALLLACGWVRYRPGRDSGKKGENGNGS